MKPKLLIIGHARHGKDTLCEDLSCYLNLNFVSSSWYACEEFIYEELKHKFGYSSVEECWRDRVKHRSLWAELISSYNEGDPTRLGRKIFESYDIYNGIRKYSEAKALIDAGLCSLVIGVDARRRLPLENSESMNDTLFYLCDLVIPNHGTREEFSDRIMKFVMLFQGEFSA